MNSQYTFTKKTNRSQMMIRPKFLALALASAIVLIGKVDVCKSVNQHVGYSSIQILGDFIKAEIIKLIKSADNFQKKIIQGISTKANEIALEYYSYLDWKQLFSLPTPLRV
jgi:hypothetical protein